MIPHYLHLARFSSLHSPKLLNRLQTERGKSLKDNETPTSAPAVERTDPSSRLWGGQVQLSHYAFPLAAVTPHMLRTKLSTPAGSRWGGGQMATVTAARRVCATGRLRDTVSVRFHSFCCSHNLPVNIGIAWTKSSAAPPVPAAGPVHAHDFPGVRQVPGTGLSLEERDKLCVLCDLFTPTGRDQQILSLATGIQP